MTLRPQGIGPEIEFFHDIFDASPIGIAVEDLDGHPLFVNPALCSFLGFSPDELCRKECVDFSPPEDAEKNWALHRQLQAGEITPYQIEKRYLRRDGSLVWGRLSISSLRGGPTPLVLAMVEDITDKKTAEDLCRESEERLRLAVHAGRMFAYSWDPATDVIERSGESAEILGVENNQAASGAAVSRMIHPDDRARVEAALKMLSVERPTLQLTYRINRPDGVTIWVERHSRAYFDSSGKLERVVGMVVDITERKRAEQLLNDTHHALEAQTAALQSQEELLKIFVKNVPAGVAMFDREMRYLQVSDRFCADYGLEASQVLGHSHYQIFPDIPQRWIEIHRRALAGETLRSAEDRWDRPSGVTSWVRWEVRPWKRTAGAIGGILLFSEDITQRKKLEEALSDLSRKAIESQEQERSRIGRELHDDISQRLALLAVEIDQLTENPSELLERVRQLRNDVTEVSTDVQALSHELHSSKLQNLGVVAGIKSWCREFSERQRMEVEFSDEVRSPVPFQVGLSLFRVIQESLHNAQKHSGANSIEVRLTEDSGQLHLTITDSGKGFERAVAKQGGGLGLTSMQERIRLMNGTIEIDSKPMHGTTIRVSVPLNQGELS